MTLPSLGWPRRDRPEEEVRWRPTLHGVTRAAIIG